MQALFIDDGLPVPLTKWEFHQHSHFAYDPQTDPEMFALATKLGGVSFNPAAVKAGDIIFLRGRNAPEFFSTIAPKINEPYIIMAHGEYKDGFKDTYVPYLDDPNLIAWFGTHAGKIPHPKLHPIPLGVRVAQDDYLKTRLKLTELLAQLRRKEKSGLLYANFDTSSHPERLKVLQNCLNSPFCSLARSLPFVDYLKEMAGYKFTLSPQGFGVDCYRTWEALYVGSIPIVKHSHLDSLYENLPILLIDDWDEISEILLLEKYKELAAQKYSFKKLRIEHWLDVISQVRENYLLHYNKGSTHADQP